jgi:hypothetical protein
MLNQSLDIPKMKFMLPLSYGVAGRKDNCLHELIWCFRFLIFALLKYADFRIIFLRMTLKKLGWPRATLAILAKSCFMPGRECGCYWFF